MKNTEKAPAYECTLCGKTHRDTAAGRGATSKYAIHFEWRLGGPREIAK